MAIVRVFPLNGVADVLTGALEEQLRGSIRKISIKSALTPDVVIDAPFVRRPGRGEPAPPGGVSTKDKILAFAQPAVIVETPQGTLTMAPWGIPQKTYYQVGALAGAAVLGLAAYGAWALLTKK